MTIGSVEITTAARRDDFEASVSILGDRGTGILAGLAANKLVTWTPQPSLCAQVSEEIPNAYGLGHKPLIADVIRHLRNGVAHPNYPLRKAFVPSDW